MSEPRGPADAGEAVGQHRAHGGYYDERARFSEEHAAWQDRTRVMLQPIAAPSILGLSALAAATMMVGAWQADWYGNAATPLILFPFVLVFGGLGQFMAGMWSYRARDGLATTMHGLWGSFWLAWGLFFLLVAIGSVPAVAAPVIGAVNIGFAFWFVPLCLITAIGALAALGRSMALAAVLLVLAAAAGFTAAGFWAPATWAVRTGGWLFVVSAGLAVYTAAAMMLEETFGRTILPLFKYRREANIPGRRASLPLEYRYGEPGVKIGQ
jgi:succinate-acetate transporter protein